MITPITARNSCTPSIVPRTMASMLLSYLRPASSVEASVPPWPGSISRAIRIDAGSEISEAEIMWPTASGTLFDRVWA